MRSLGLLVPLAVLALGCVTDVDPESATEVTTDPDGPGHEQPPPDGSAGMLSAIFNPQQGCDDRVVSYDITALLDGEPTADLDCTLTVEGVTLHGCQGRHVFETAGVRPVTVTATHRPSGAMATLEDTLIVYDPFFLDVEVKAPACGLSFRYTPIWAPDIDMLVSFVEPAEDVVSSSGTAGSFDVVVSQAGTYDVTVHAEDERVGPICSDTVIRQVTVVACDDHEHTPTCEH